MTTALVPCNPQGPHAPDNRILITSLNHPFRSILRGFLHKLTAQALSSPYSRLTKCVQERRILRRLCKNLSVRVTPQSPTTCYYRPAKAWLVQTLVHRKGGCGIRIHRLEPFTVPAQDLACNKTRCRCGEVAELGSSSLCCPFAPR